MISPILAMIVSVTAGVWAPHVATSVPFFTPISYAADQTVLARAAGLPVSAPREASVLHLKNDPAPVPQHSAESLLLVDATEGNVLFASHADETIPLASLTKLATVLTFLDLNVPKTNVVTITPDDVIDARSSLEVGDKVSVDDLIGLTLVGSSNSAAHALVTASGLSEQYFVGRMNRRAEELGLSHTHFVEPTGLNSHNVGTALDVYRMLSASGNYAEVRALAQKDSYTFWNGKEQKTMKATDELVSGAVPFRGQEIVAAKTGYIPESGFHVALIARDELNNDRIAIVMGATSTLARFKEADDLLHWGANNFVK